MPNLRARGRSRRPSPLIHAFASPALIEDSGPLTLVRGKGAYVWDEGGKKYLDCVSALWNVAVGYGRAEIARAVADQIRTLSYAPTLLGLSNRPAQQLAERLVRLAPKGLTRVMFTSGGSEANETVIRLVRLHSRLRGKPDKIKFVALDRAYHGSSTGSASLTGLPNFHSHYEPLMPGVVRMMRPHCYRCDLGLTHPACRLACADELEKIVEREGADTIGAFIAEPVQGVGGVIVPPDGYFRRIREICDRHDILLVVDEVITGFGRTGHNFGIDREKVTPDMLVFAKGVTSGYLPLGGVMLREEIYQTLLAAGPQFGLHHGYTYSGHPVACAGALANLDILEKEKLVARTRRLASHLERRLRGLAKHPIVGEVRSAGLMGAVELVRDRSTRESFPAELNVAARIRAFGLERGIILRASGDNVVVCLPLIVEKHEIDRMAGVLDAAIESVCATL